MEEKKGKECLNWKGGREMVQCLEAFWYLYKQGPWVVCGHKCSRVPFHILKADATCAWAPLCLIRKRFGNTSFICIEKSLLQEEGSYEKFSLPEREKEVWGPDGSTIAPERTRAQKGREISQRLFNQKERKSILPPVARKEGSMSDDIHNFIFYSTPPWPPSSKKNPKCSQKIK